MRQLCIILVALAAVAGVTPKASADDVTDQIGEALKAYKNNDYTAAVAALDAAANLVRQMKTDAIKRFLPEPLPGWAAEDAEGAAFGPALLGGGSTVSRRYKKSADSVEISLVTDSPLLQGFGAFFGAAMMTGPDMKTSVIDGRRFTYTRSDNSYQAMIGGKVMLTVKGTKGVDEETLKAYIKATKLQDLEKLGP